MNRLQTDYLKEKLQITIGEREARIARLEAEAREDRLRFAARNMDNERPLRISRSRSQNGDRFKAKDNYDRVF